MAYDTDPTRLGNTEDALLGDVRKIILFPEVTAENEVTFNVISSANTGETLIYCFQ